MTSLANLGRDGLIRNNPALVQLLGLCPLLAVSGSTVSALGLGLVTLAVLSMSNLCISLMRGLITDNIRLPAQILVIATFVTIADLVLQAWYFDLHQRIGLFVALIVTNCTLLGRAEAFASRHGPLIALWDGFVMGLGFLWVLVVMGVVREVLGKGTLLANSSWLFDGHWQGFVVFDSGFLLMTLPPGAFLTLGCLIALKNRIYGQ